MTKPSERAQGGVALDLFLGAGALLVAALLVIGTAGLPPPRFEPMGSAALPRILAGVIALLSLGVVVSAFRSRGKTTSETAEKRRSPVRALAVPVLLAAYVAALDVGNAPFVPATIVFVMAMGLVLSRPALRTIVSFALFGAALALLIDGVFTQFLFVDL